MEVLADLFTPTRVAIVGATDRPNSIGRAIMTNLTATFNGDVIPINPNYDTVLGIPCNPTLDAVDDIDLAVIVVPADTAIDIIEDAADAGITNVVVITAGFSEAGRDGVDRERRLTQLAADHDLNLVGPNSIGIISTPNGLNATFAPTTPAPGPISFLSQSGAVITATLDWAHDRHIGFNDVVSLGNKAVLDETDFIETWGDDPDTDVIIGYLESIKHGQEFIDRVRTVTDNTPVLLIKAGRTDAGATAASSHTGAIAGSDRAYEAGLAQAGVIRMHSLQSLFDSARALALLPLPETDSIAIISNAGGIGVMATDALAETTLSLATFTDNTRTTLTETLPPGANRYNPVDIIGDAPVNRFETTLTTVLDDPNVSAAVVLSAPTGVLSYTDLATSIATTAETTTKPIITGLLGGERVEPAEAILHEAGIPNYLDPHRAINSLDTLSRYRDIKRRPTQEPTTFAVDRDRAHTILTTGTTPTTNYLGVEAMDLLDAYGIPTPPSTIVTSPNEAATAADQFDGPVVMKIVSPDILHKTDIGGVKLNVTPDEAATAYDDLISRAYSYQPTATIIGVQLQQQLDTTTGVETIVGMTHDPQFGPVVLFGLGGIFVEVLEDTAVRVAPISDDDARSMVTEINAAQLLRGVRGRDPVAIDDLVETIQRIAQLTTDFPAILELDINPLLATPTGVTAMDLRLTVNPDQL